MNRRRSCAVAHLCIVALEEASGRPTQQEVHNGRRLWTRKGAFKAGTGDLLVIPGSMGTHSYIVAGKGNPASWTSCSHGAGRRHSRTQAKKLFTRAALVEVRHTLHQVLNYKGT